MRVIEATIADIPGMQRVRLSVNENVLSDPSRVTSADYVEMIEQRGQGWVCETDGDVMGFSICDLEGQNLWALFVDPAYEGRGLGRRLHDQAVSWFFDSGTSALWLTTEPGSRAEAFYRAAGWTLSGTEPNGELRLGMTRQVWVTKPR